MSAWAVDGADHLLHGQHWGMMRETQGIVMVPHSNPDSQAGYKGDVCQLGNNHKGKGSFLFFLGQSFILLQRFDLVSKIFCNMWQAVWFSADSALSRKYNVSSNLIKFAPVCSLSRETFSQLWRMSSQFWLPIYYDCLAIYYDYHNFVFHYSANFYI